MDKIAIKSAAKKVFFYWGPLVMVVVVVGMAISTMNPDLINFMIITLVTITLLFLLAIVLPPIKIYSLWGIILVVYALWPGGLVSIRVGPGSGVPVEYLPLLCILGSGIIASVIRGDLSLRNLPSPLVVLASGIALYMLTSIYWVSDRSSWLISSIMFSFYIIALFAMVGSLSKKPIDFQLKLINLLLLATTLFGLVGIIRFAIWTGRYLGDFSPVTQYRSSEISILLLLIPVAFALYFQSRRIKFLASIIILSSAVVLSFSRTGFIGLSLSVAIVIFIVIRAFSFARASAKLMVLLSVFLIVFSASYLVVGNPILERIESITLVQRIWFDDDLTLSTQGGRRHALQAQAIEVFRQSPWLGTGPGNYLNSLDTADPYLQARSHNFYLSYLAEFGLIGFIPLVGFIFYLTYFLWNNAFKTMEKNLRLISLSFATAQTSLLVMLLAQEFVSSPYIWFYWGLATAYVVSAEKAKNRVTSVDNEQQIYDVKKYGLGDRGSEPIENSGFFTVSRV